ncbi:hypothetical protein O181_081948 [Austropuccinia psidii MF-1]|uniref:Uncharacterized protein n=1 Tax=Austropuccinia psidii MF-1 TaxID=1389203 RepID=A0A9Q3FQT6_9BASI|nr:hypothetical protein [Austropuccinia psidii MF-1]
MDLIHLQDVKMQKTKPARGKDYTSGASCITNIVITNREAKLYLDSGAFCTCDGKDYLARTYANWKEILMPIEGITSEVIANICTPRAFLKQKSYSIILQEASD